MKRLALLLLPLLLLAGCPAKKDTPWDVACRMLRDVYSCEGIPEPNIKYFDDEPGAPYGYYEGGDTIFINRIRQGWEWQETVFHETVHYLQHMVGNLELPGPARDVCAAEEEAFRVTDIYLELVLERPEDKVGDDWWAPYWYCWEFYAPAGSIGIFIADDDGNAIIRIY